MLVWTESEDVTLVMLPFQIHKVIQKVLKYFVELLKLKSKCLLKIQVSEYKISNKFEVSALFITYIIIVIPSLCNEKTKTVIAIAS